MFKHCKSWQVVISLEGSYSIWPTDKIIPLGWLNGGKISTKVECLSYIKEVWVGCEYAAKGKRK